MLRMIASTLLKSWAMPAARRPIASIFRACASWPSSCTCRVTSRLTAT